MLFVKDIILKKQQQVKEISELINKSKSFILFEYQGLTAAEITALRKEIFAKGSQMKVLKNNIIDRAFKESKIAEFETMMTGPNALLFALEDEMSIFKSLYEVSKQHDFIKIKGGYFNSKFVSADEVKAIAAIPNREVLYSMLLSCLTSPIRKVLYALKAVAETKPQ